MQLIVLRLDYRSSSQLEFLQQQAKAAMGGIGEIYPPHISLQLLEQANPADLKTAVSKFAEAAAQIPLTFSSVGFFKQKGTFFASPVATDSLLKFHQAATLATQEFSGQQDYYLPGNWAPHATIANHIAPPFWGPLFARLALEFEPFSGKAVAVECWSLVNGKVQVEWSIFLAE